jgi:hypothetical protein
VEPSGSGGPAVPTVAPTVAPSKLRSDSGAPGTINLQLVWLVLIMGAFGVGLVLLSLVRSRNDVQMMKSRSGDASPGPDDEPAADASKDV